MLIFSLHEMKYIWYSPQKSKFSFYFILYGNTEITTLLFTWSFLVRFDFCSVFIGYNFGCKHSLHLENGLESYLTKEIKKSAFKESLLSVPYGWRHVHTGATPGQTVTSLCLMLTSQHA